MVRKAVPADLDRVAEIYDQIHTATEQGRLPTAWRRGSYPTRRDAEEALAAGELYVLEEDGRVLASARINQAQDEAYARMNWAAEAPPERVLVLHTLAVSTEASGKGLGTAFVRFYEDEARRRGCPFLRLDTSGNNFRARALYRRLGYRETGTVSCTFNGLPGIALVGLEKTLTEEGETVCMLK